MKRLTALLLAWPIGSLAQGPSEARLLLGGNHPDPSILRDGEDYYLTHSSFEYQPGLLIWHSRDLRNWQPVTHALRHFDTTVWAPELIRHEGRYSFASI